jgi:hypothetical protein
MESAGVVAAEHAEMQQSGDVTVRRAARLRHASGQLGERDALCAGGGDLVEYLERAHDAR